MSSITVVFVLLTAMITDYGGFTSTKRKHIRSQISVMVFIQELSLARTRIRSSISLVDTLNSLIINRFQCYAKITGLKKKA